MMSTTYVCVDCRTSARGSFVPGLQGGHQCPKCRNYMFRLFPCTRIPRQDDTKGWLEIRRELKRMENRWFSNRENLARWEISEREEKDEKLKILAQEASSEQELKFLEWRRKDLSVQKS